MHRADVLLREARKRLEHHGIPSAARDARLLLQAAARVAHERLIAEPDHPLTDEIRSVFDASINRRASGEPVARILGTREFWNVTLAVTPDVLDPRPETEHLVSEAIAVLRPGQCFLDLGTGSGAIAIALVSQRDDITGVATDRSQGALRIAEANADVLGLADRLRFLHADWFQGVAGRFDLIVSNPPYIRSADIDGLARDVKDFDPRMALDGGADGLGCYRAIAGSAQPHLEAGGRIIVEIGHDQADDVTDIFAQSGFEAMKRYKDHAGHARGLIFARPR
jgi:release factor glutamine methyltransferase